MTKGNTGGEEEIFEIVSEAGGRCLGKENEGQLFWGDAWRLFGD
jgi:hypothetical protein